MARTREQYLPRTCFQNSACFLPLPSTTLKKSTMALCISSLDATDWYDDECLLMACDGVKVPARRCRFACQVHNHVKTSGRATHPPLHMFWTAHAYKPQIARLTYPLTHTRT